MTTNTQVEELREKILNILLEPQLCIQTGKDYPNGYLSGSYNWYADTLTALLTAELELAKIDAKIEELGTLPIAKSMIYAVDRRISELTKQKQELLNE